MMHFKKNKIMSIEEFAEKMNIIWDDDNATLDEKITKTTPLHNLALDSNNKELQCFFYATFYAKSQEHQMKENCFSKQNLGASSN